MQNVTELLPRSGQSTTTTQAGSQAPRDRATAALVNQIFRELRVLCTAWKNTVEGDIQGYVNEYKRALLEALVREGVNDWGQVKRGLAAIASPFLPNPNQFAKDCKGGNEITGAWGTAAHRIYEPERMLVDLGAKERSKTAGREALGSLKEIL